MDIPSCNQTWQWEIINGGLEHHVITFDYWRLFLFNPANGTMMIQIHFHSLRRWEMPPRTLVIAWATLQNLGCQCRGACFGWQVATSWICFPMRTYVYDCIWLKTQLTLFTDSEPPFCAHSWAQNMTFGLPCKLSFNKIQENYEFDQRN